MPKPRIHKHSQAELAKLVGVTAQSLRTWRDAEGLDLADVAAVQARAGRVERDEPTDGVESYTDARRRRASADADRAEIIAKREAGSVIALSDVEALMVEIGATMRSRLLSMRSDLVVELEGRTGAQIYAALDKRITELLTAIHNNSPIPKS